jgi:hypothetical protein
LLRLFGFAKSLEEIDQMDIGRLSRSLEALKYSDAWGRHHEPALPKLPNVRKAAMAEIEQDKKAEDRKLVNELARLAVDYADGKLED